MSDNMYARIIEEAVIMIVSQEHPLEIWNDYVITIYYTFYSNIYIFLSFINCKMLAFLLLNKEKLSS